MEKHHFERLLPDLENAFVPKGSGESSDCSLVIGAYASDGNFGAM